jgi:hypothetical protein
VAIDTWGNGRPEFVERIAKLAGGTTYRAPMEGGGTKEAQLPDVHAIAAALAFARRGPDDVGPDVAYCWVLQNNVYRRRTVLKLADALRCHEFRHVTTYRLQAAEAAWDAMIWNHMAKRPADARPAYDTMLMVACKTLHDAAWDSLAEAERRYRRVA